MGRGYKTDLFPALLKWQKFLFQGQVGIQEMKHQLTGGCDQWKEPNEGPLPQEAMDFSRGWPYVPLHV
jgi:hypothetical protein